jgi:hypothetical protein
LAMILSVFFQLPFVHDSFFLFSVSLWPWYCLSFVSFPLAMLVSVFCQIPFVHDIVCLFHGQMKTDKRQTITCPKENWQKTDIIMAKGKRTKDRQYEGKRKTEKDRQ